MPVMTLLLAVFYLLTIYGLLIIAKHVIKRLLKNDASLEI